MSMTHYMELLMNNSPWNLLFFMALPVVLAETIAITELIILYSKKNEENILFINKMVGIISGIVFLGISIYLITTLVLPISFQGQWRGWIDVLSVFAYLASALPMFLISLLNLNLILKNKEKHIKEGFHLFCIASFLIISHVAMIAGMADPSLGGWKDKAKEIKTEMHHMHHSNLKMNADFASLTIAFPNEKNFKNS